MLDLGECSRRCGVLRRGTQDVLEFRGRFIVQAGFEECAAKSDTGRQVGGMTLETGPAGCDRVGELAGAAILLRKRRKRDGRRVRLNPPLQLCNTRRFGHAIEAEGCGRCRSLSPDPP